MFLYHTKTKIYLPCDFLVVWKSLSETSLVCLSLDQIIFGNITAPGWVRCMNEKKFVKAVKPMFKKIQINHGYRNDILEKKILIPMHMQLLNIAKFDKNFCI